MVTSFKSFVNDFKSFECKFIMSTSDGRELSLEEFITFTLDRYGSNAERGHVNRLQKCARINL